MASAKGQDLVIIYRSLQRKMLKLKLVTRRVVVLKRVAVKEQQIRMILKKLSPA
jgi:hypothetical protein